MHLWFGLAWYGQTYHCWDAMCCSQIWTLTLWPILVDYLKNKEASLYLLEIYQQHGQLQENILPLNMHTKGHHAKSLELHKQHVHGRRGLQWKGSIRWWAVTIFHRLEQELLQRWVSFGQFVGTWICCHMCATHLSKQRATFAFIIWTCSISALL